MEEDKKAKKSFVFYRSHYDAIMALEDKNDKLQLYEAMANYALNEIEPQLHGALNAVWVAIKEQLRINNERYHNALLGGAPSGNANYAGSGKTTKRQPNNNRKTTNRQPKVNQDSTKRQPNDNDNDNDNEISLKRNRYRADGSALLGAGLSSTAAPVSSTAPDVPEPNPADYADPWDFISAWEFKHEQRMPQYMRDRYVAQF